MQVNIYLLYILYYLYYILYYIYILYIYYTIIYYTLLLCDFYLNFCTCGPWSRISSEQIQHNKNLNKTSSIANLHLSTVFSTISPHMRIMKQIKPPYRSSLVSYVIFLWRNPSPAYKGKTLNRGSTYLIGSALNRRSVLLVPSKIWTSSQCNRGALPTLVRANKTVLS